MNKPEDPPKRKRSPVVTAASLVIATGLLPFLGMRGMGPWYFALPFFAAAAMLTIVCAARGRRGDGMMFLMAALFVPFWLEWFPPVLAEFKRGRAERARVDAEAAQRRSEQTPRVFVSRQPQPARNPTPTPTPASP